MSVKENTKLLLEERNHRIINAIIKKAENICPNSIALIGVGGSFCSGDIYEKSDLDLMIVINDDKAWQISSCFILGEVGHDIYCTPWSSLEKMAEYNDPYVVKLLDIKMVYCADETYLKRYNDLREKLKYKMDFPFSFEDIQRAEGFVRDAQVEYATVMTSDDIGSCRFAFAKILYNIEFALYILNKTYIKQGIKRIPDEISKMKMLPTDFMQYYMNMINAKTISDMRKCCTELIKSIREYFIMLENSNKPKKESITADAIRGSYEEIFSNWRNKMYHAIERNDAYLSLMTASSCQNFYNGMYDEFNIEHIDIIRYFNPSDLVHSAQAFDDAMGEYLKLYQKLDIPVRLYKTIEDFEENYLSTK